MRSAVGLSMGVIHGDRRAPGNSGRHDGAHPCPMNVTPAKAGVYARLRKALQFETCCESLPSDAYVTEVAFAETCVGAGLRRHDVPGGLLIKGTSSPCLL